MLTIHNHLLDGNLGGSPVAQSPSDNHNGSITPRFVIFHYTACSREAARSAFLNKQGQNRVSAHLLIGEDGSVEQFVPFDRRAWHAGLSRWGALKDLNSHSVGIEIVNHGYLQRSASGGFRTSAGHPSPVAADDILELRHKNPACPYTHWQAFTAEQIDSCEQIVAALFGHYNTLEDVLGHDDVAPERKVDPGPAFPMIRVRSRALGRDAGILTEEVAYVAVPHLNIRRGPGVSHARVRPEPLPQHTRMVIRGRREGWLQVAVDGEVPLEGWVLGEYTTSMPG